MTEPELEAKIKDTIHRELGICNKDVVRDLMKLVREYYNSNAPSVDMTGRDTEPYSEAAHKI